MRTYVPSSARKSNRVRFIFLGIEPAVRFRNRLLGASSALYNTDQIGLCI